MLDEVSRVLASAGADLERTWVVGGAVRDALLGRPVHDLDLAIDRHALPLARELADRLGGAYFPLDEERGCGRVVLTVPESRLEIDLTDLRAPSLAADLAERDFTCNAIAVALARPSTLIDPMNGVSDLFAGRLRAPSPEVLAADPLRGVRGVRLAAELGFTLEPLTRGWIRDAAPHLTLVAAERRGSELWKCFAAPRTAWALAELRELGLLAALVPEAEAAAACPPAGGHRLDVWDHTLSVVAWCEWLRDRIAGNLSWHRDARIAVAAPAAATAGPLATLATEATAPLAVNPGPTTRLVPTTPDPGDAVEAILAATLGPFRAALADRFARPFAVGRVRGPWLELAAFFHDLGKPFVARSCAAEGGTRDGAGFPGHAERGALLAQDRLTALRFRRDEAAWVAGVVRHHRAVRALDAATPLDARTLHRFLRTTGDGDVEVALLSLADLLGRWTRPPAAAGACHPLPAAAQPADLPAQPILAGPFLAEPFLAEPALAEPALAALRQRADRVREILAAALERRHEILPTPLLGGRDLLAAGLPPGPAIGAILSALAEAQAAGEVVDPNSALEFALRLARRLATQPGPAAERSPGD